MPFCLSICVSLRLSLKDSFNSLSLCLCLCLPPPPSLSLSLRRVLQALCLSSCPSSSLLTAQAQVGPWLPLGPPFSIPRRGETGASQRWGCCQPKGQDQRVGEAGRGLWESRPGKGSQPSARPQPLVLLWGFASVPLPSTPFSCLCLPGEPWGPPNPAVALTRCETQVR